MNSQWRPSKKQQDFIRQYSRAVEAGDAAIFVGAGLSRPAGYVDWKGLLKEIADELDLSIERESDLVALTQYHVNEKNSRGRLNQMLIEEFTKSTESTRSHNLIAHLPIRSIWTTNYDQLIERAFESAGKIIDVKLTTENLALSRRRRDATLFKMHGCVTQPHDAVLTKDDYERYSTSRALFVEKLKGDLISKTFLFLGFSFADPNIDQVLGRVRVLLDKNQRGHFAIMRTPTRSADLSGVAAAEFDYARRKFDLLVSDLRRFSIETVNIEDYEEVEGLLEAVSVFAHRKNVLVSGSVQEFGVMNQEKVETLSRSIGRALIEQGFNLVSGYGLGIGEYCVLDALRALYGVRKENEDDRVIIRPFPRAKGSAAEQRSQDTLHREDLIARSGAVIFIGGNRKDSAGATEPAAGVREEFNIAKSQRRFVIPIGATGYVAREIWEEVVSEQDIFYRGIDVADELRVLGDPNRSVSELAAAALGIVSKSAASREI